MGASTARVQAGRYRTLYRHGAFGLVPGTNNCRLAAGLPSEPAKGLMARLLVPSLPIVVVDAADRFDQSHPLELQRLIVDRAECLAGPHKLIGSVISACISRPALLMLPPSS